MATPDTTHEERLTQELFDKVRARRCVACGTSRLFAHVYARHAHAAAARREQLLEHSEDMFLMGNGAALRARRLARRAHTTVCTLDALTV
jgi:hypothetical protein